MSIRKSETSKTTEDDPTKFTKRLILAPQSAGRIGKSTVAEAIYIWADYAGVANVLFDLDGEHTTLSNRYPAETTVYPDAVKNDTGWARFLSAVAEVDVPMVLADLPAQSTDYLLRQLVERGGLDVLKEAGVRITMLIFPIDDTAGRQSAVDCVRTLDAEVDWIVVRQPGPKALISEETWDAAKLGKKLNELGAGTLQLPELTKLAFEEYEKQVAKEGRWISFNDIGERVGIVARHEFALWRNQALAGCEDLAEYFLPDVKLIETKVVKADAPAKFTSRAPGAVGLDL